MEAIYFILYLMSVFGTAIVVIIMHWWDDDIYSDYSGAYSVVGFNIILAGLVVPVMIISYIAITLFCKVIKPKIDICRALLKNMVKIYKRA